MSVANHGIPPIALPPAEQYPPQYYFASIFPRKLLQLYIFQCIYVKTRTFSFDFPINPLSELSSATRTGGEGSVTLVPLGSRILELETTRNPGPDSQNLVIFLSAIYITRGQKRVAFSL